MKITQVLNSLLDGIGKGLVVCSNGKMGRVLFALRKKRGEPNDDLILQGSMGASISVGLGIALNTDKQVYVLTGDGALLMKLGSLATVAKAKLDNLHLIVLNNGVYESTGGQPTTFEKVRDFVSKYCRVIDIERGYGDLPRPNISCQQIKNNFIAKVRQ